MDEKKNLRNTFLTGVVSYTGLRVAMYAFDGIEKVCGAISSKMKNRRPHPHFNTVDEDEE